MDQDLKGWLFDLLAVVSCIYAVSVAVRALLTFI
jgi:hypothetical protein